MTVVQKEGRGSPNQADLCRPLYLDKCKGPVWMQIIEHRKNCKSYAPHSLSKHSTFVSFCPISLQQNTIITCPVKRQHYLQLPICCQGTQGSHSKFVGEGFQKVQKLFVEVKKQKRCMNEKFERVVCFSQFYLQI